jgi:hypothetical protein
MCRIAEPQGWQRFEKWLLVQNTPKESARERSQHMVLHHAAAWPID